MTSTSLCTRAPSLSDEEHDKCVAWAARMDQAVLNKGDPPMEQAPLCYDIYRRYNPAAIDPIQGRTLQQQHREISNLRELRELQRGIQGVSAAPEPTDSISHRTFELVVDTLKDFNSSAERNHRSTLDSALKALRFTGRSYPRASQRGNRRESHYEQRGGRPTSSGRRPDAGDRAVRFSRPIRRDDLGVPAPDLDARPSRIIRPHASRLAARADTPHPGSRSFSRPLPLDYEYDYREEMDQVMEDAFPAPAIDPEATPRPAGPAEFQEAPPSPGDGERAPPPTPAPAGCAAGTIQPIADPPTATAAFIFGNSSFPSQPFSFQSFPFPGEATREATPSSCSALGLEGVPTLSPTNSRIDAFEALPMGLAPSEPALSVTDGLQGLELDGVTSAADDYVRSLGPDPLTV